jgi:hypothetical protein
MIRIWPGDIAVYVRKNTRTDICPSVHSAVEITPAKRIYI